MAPEVSAKNAAGIIGTSSKNIWEKVHDGKLKARRQGERRLIFIEVEELRRFAQEYGYRFNEQLARELSVE